MTEVFAALVAFGTLFGLALIGIPLAAAMALGGLAGMLAAGIPVIGAPIAVMGVLGNFAWLALPLFIMLGGLLSQIGVSQGIVRFGEAVGRRLRGGTSQVVIVSSLFMGGMTGSTLSEAGMLSSMFRKDMEKLGYPRGYLAGLISCAGLIGALIPPSNILLILGLAGQTSILRLWIAGIVPGFLLGIGLMVVAALMHRRYDEVKTPGAATSGGSAPSVRSTIGYALPGLAVPIFILGGMRFGVFSPVEAGAAGILFSLLLGLLLYRRDLSASRLANGLSGDMLNAMGYLLLVAGAAVFGVVIVRLNIGTAVEEFFVAADYTPLRFMLATFAIFFVMGFFIEAVPIMLIFFPMMLPAAEAVGIDPTHYGVSFSMIILLANLTPPVGVQTLFVCRLIDTNVFEWWRHGKYFFAVVLALTLAVMFVPQISLTLPEIILR